jgi:hypothetical protein
MNRSINIQSTAAGQMSGSKLANVSALPSKESAQYIADMVLELRNLAKACDFKTLQGLLEVTYYEAFGMAHQVHIPANEHERLQEMGQDAERAAAAF